MVRKTLEIRQIVLNNSKNKLMKIFCEFLIFKYPLMVKNESPQMPETNIKLSKLKKHPVVAVIITRKLLKCNQFVV